MVQFITGAQSSASALEAERIRMEVISQNIANAFVTKGVDGKPYQRQQVVFEGLLQQQLGGASGEAAPQSVHVARIEKDNSPSKMIHWPGHPHADAQGMVAMPNVDTHMEMADYITSSRAYEANLAVLKSARYMAMQTLSIGKR